MGSSEDAGEQWTKMNELMNNLFVWGQDFFLQSVFLRYKQLKILQKCLCWLERFYWCKSVGMQKIQAEFNKEIMAWFLSLSENTQLAQIWSRSVTSVTCDENIIFCGYADGRCKIYSINSGEQLGVIDDTAPDIHYSHCKVYIGRDIIVRIAFGFSTPNNEGRCDIGVWSKETRRKLFRTVHRNRNMCFFLRVIDNTIIVREGRNFCRISILEDCSIKYKALHHLDRLLRGDFLANSNFIVSKHGDKIMYLQLEPHYKIFEVYISKKIIDICLHENFLLILHDSSITLFNLNTGSTHDNVVKLDKKPISMEVNSHVLAVLDQSNDVHIFSMTDTLHCSSKMPVTGTCIKLKISCNSKTSFPKISLTPTSLIAYSYICDTFLVYSLWEL